MAHHLDLADLDLSNLFGHQPNDWEAYEHVAESCRVDVQNLEDCGELEVSDDVPGGWGQVQGQIVEEVVPVPVGLPVCQQNPDTTLRKELG